MVFNCRFSEIIKNLSKLFCSFNLSYFFFLIHSSLAWLKMIIFQSKIRPFSWIFHFKKFHVFFVIGVLMKSVLSHQLHFLTVSFSLQTYNKCFCFLSFFCFLHIFQLYYHSSKKRFHRSTKQLYSKYFYLDRVSLDCGREFFKKINCSCSHIFNKTSKSHCWVQPR